METNDSNLLKLLLEKSKEAFIMSVEIYNKPTIKYRVEGFSFFICNAWELMLKAHILNKLGNNSIYYKDNPNKTISLSECIKKVFTNDKDPLRINLEKIIELRDTSTHFVTTEYEMIYVPLFQACLFNFNEKMQQFHNIDMSEIIPQNFLTLTTNMKSFNELEIRAKYPEELTNHIVQTQIELNELIEENNSNFAIKIEHYHYITKNKNEATEILNIDNNSSDNVKVIKELKDPNVTHKYTMKKLNQEVSKKLNKLGITIEFNQYHFRLFANYYNMKNNPKFCYVNTIGRTPTYSYSLQAIDFIVEEFKKDPDNIIQNLKNKLKINKLTPGAKDF